MKRVLFAIALAACGGSDHVDLSGVYQVSSDVGSMPCGTDMPVMMAPAYLHFEKMMLVGQTYYTYEGCSDAAATMCDGSGGLLTAFTEPTSNGWNGRVTEWSGSGGTCALTYDIRSAMLSGKQLSIDIEDHSGSEMVPDAQCTDAEAQKVGPMLPCTAHEHIEATKQ